MNWEVGIDYSVENEKLMRTYWIALGTRLSALW